MDVWNADEFGHIVQEVNMVPVRAQASQDDMDKARAERAKLQQQQMEMAQAQTVSDAYVKTAKAPEEGSGAEELMNKLS